MLINKNQYDLEYDVEFLLERPIGWSSACFDSTINYYLDCNNANIESLSSKESIESKEEKEI